jgi:Zn-dependent protease with chaperone function
MWSRGWVPRLSESPSIELPELDEVQVRYATRYRLRFALFVLVPVLLVAYFAARIVMVGPEPVAGPDTGQFLGWATAIVTTSTSAGLVARLMSEERLARTHPPLADAVPPLGRRAVKLVPLLVVLAIIAIGGLVPGRLMGAAIMAVGFVMLVVVTKIYQRSLSARRHEVPWDDPLGQHLAPVMEKCGFKPKKLVLLPNLVANALALPDGSALITTALRVIASDDEIAAIFAHEISHLKDGDVKKLLNRGQLARLPIAVIVALPTVLGRHSSFGPYLPPVAIGSIFLAVIAGNLWAARLSHMLEYKCDATAKSLGLGDELAAGLIKISRYTGLPANWIGLDRFTLSHPALAERVNRLTDGRLDLSKETAATA